MDVKTRAQLAITATQTTLDNTRLSEHSAEHSRRGWNAANEEVLVLKKGGQCALDCA
jgi:hypothetical protein